MNSVRTKEIIKSQKKLKHILYKFVANLDEVAKPGEKIQTWLPHFRELQYKYLIWNSMLYDGNFRNINETRYSNTKFFISTRHS